ncbi:hypothetical protein DFH08DRAFT_875747 [Mycena albidolilacea]|uniref:Extracellular serine-rich protein n=1 Tax=Mycena albidolilacea TaxID=1033008 RepID=A0AAD6ZVL3_9AGAR|nr:hypothetical protein DFH08DRAFT_875747 [Mycena albidolilacea]
MRFLSFAVLATFAMVSAQKVIPVQVGGNPGSPGGVTVFSPSQISANNNDIISFQFSGVPGNHSVTQSSFLNPCEPLDKGFDSGWVSVPQNLSSVPEWNVTITNDTAPIWFYCKQLLSKTDPVKPHCNLGMVGVINIEKGQKSFSDFLASASAAPTVGQAEGAFVGVGASATGAPSLPSGAAYFGGSAAAGDSGNGATPTSPGAPPASSTPAGSGFANKASSGVVLLATLFGIVVAM